MDSLQFALYFGYYYILVLIWVFSNMLDAATKRNSSPVSPVNTVQTPSARNEKPSTEPSKIVSQPSVSTYKTQTGSPWGTLQTTVRLTADLPAKLTEGATRTIVAPAVSKVSVPIQKKVTECEKCGFEFKYEGQKATHIICKFYGYFQCTHCSYRWQSAHVWEGKCQWCKKCKTANYAYRTEKLQRSGEEPTHDDNQKPHETSLCQRCRELGRPCFVRHTSHSYGSSYEFDDD